MSHVRLGESLRKCRRFIRPPYSQKDLAACILSEPVCQGLFPSSIQRPDDLVPIIKELEAHGTWTLPPSLLDPFLEASVNCLAAACHPNLLTEYAAIIVETTIADLDSGYRTIIDHYLPQQGNPSETEDEEKTDEDGEDDDDNHND
ncbi:MAG: hypothetical protein C5B60_05715 [Chloroflexi bacterium]|nr:MAG: hypothetical protein C5B60_05715 [Chloroflexota bacterium]